ncbi:hypothetical protein CHS0354_030057 [Potamilus streckersoni]|uniref:Uncharacterized protein n=1 Tax=Potamilus streckersoni TaxID=2493646 RepID=A0AAE0RM93_9BIVA|nr:hypothetical protein CHS0354_030057 [Potamilus streckersoni]
MKVSPHKKAAVSRNRSPRRGAMFDFKIRYTVIQTVSRTNRKKLTPNSISRMPGFNPEYCATASSVGNSSKKAKSQLITRGSACRNSVLSSSLPIDASETITRSDVQSHPVNTGLMWSALKPLPAKRAAKNCGSNSPA